MEGFLSHTQLFPAQQGSVLPEIYSIVKSSPENSRGRSSRSAFSPFRQRGAGSHPILLRESTRWPRQQGWLAQGRCCCSAHEAAAWLQTPQALGPIQECFCFPSRSICAFPLVCVTFPSTQGCDWYLQYPDTRTCPVLASFPEGLIPLLLLEKMMFILGPCFCSLWCGSRLFLWLWNNSTAKPWPLWVVWYMHVSVPESLPLLELCSCRRELSSPVVPIWELKGSTSLFQWQGLGF